MAQKSNGHKFIIVSVDLFGYSRLMEEDENGTHRALMACRRAILEPIVSEKNGHIIKSTGDGALITFPTAAAALSGMIVFQERVKFSEASRPGSRRLVFRIGIHSAEAIRDDGDLYGHGVNLAVRLQEAAEPGSIYLSDAVVGELKNSSALGIVCRGRKAFKNLKESIWVYCWQGEEIEERGQKRPSRGFHGKMAVAVLAGVAMLTLPAGTMPSGREKSSVNRSVQTGEQVREPWTKNASNAARAEQRVSVKATTSKPSGHFSDAQGSHYSLVGHLLPDEDRVRIQVQINKVPIGRYLWAEGLDASLSDTVLRRAAEAKIGAGLPEAGLEVSQRSFQSRREIADDLYVRAWMFYQRNSPLDLQKAWWALDEVLVLEPRHAEAHALLAAVYWNSWRKKWPLGTGDTAVRTLKLAQDHLNKVDKPTAMSHAVTAEMLTASGHHAEAIKEAERAMLLEPSMAVGYYAKGLALMFDGRPDQGESLIRTARRLDPQATQYLFGLAFAQFNQERYQDAFSTLSLATATNLKDDWPFLLLAATSGHLGRHEDAKHALGRFDRLSLARRGWFASQIPYVYAWPFSHGLDRQRLHEGMILAGIPDTVDLVAR